MKKFLTFVVIVAIFVGLFYGLKYLKDNGYLDNVFNSKETSTTNGSNGAINNDKTNKTTKTTKTTTEVTVKYPDEWEMLFDYENFSVESTSYFMGLRKVYYKRIDSKYYIYIEESDTWDETTNVVFDFKKFYNSFTFDSDSNTYTAENLHTDETDWVTDVMIRVYDNKIVRIETDQHMASLHITTSYDFGSYGSTQLEN